MDVGSGNGVHILELRDIGVYAFGLDPHINQDHWMNVSMLFIKAYLKEIHNSFDLITFHHWFEHLTNPLETLVHAKSLLKPYGKILLRIPITSSWAFETYREKLVSIGCSQTLFFHSHKSIELLAKRANLYILDLWCDSNTM